MAKKCNWCGKPITNLRRNYCNDKCRRMQRNQYANIKNIQKRHLEKEREKQFQTMSPQEILNAVGYIRGHAT